MKEIGDVLETANGAKAERIASLTAFLHHRCNACHHQFGLGALDPLTYASVAAALATVCRIACWLPAGRAVIASPAVMLRER